MKKRIVILSGAGISAESGISTFRDANGLWENYRIEEVATPEAWLANPDLVTLFYNQRRRQVLNSKPNAAHLFFKELEEKYDVSIVTQNIDDLHERAGSNHVLHLHGNITEAISSNPSKNDNRIYQIKGSELDALATCEQGYRLRPNVVWFGEPVPLMNDAMNLVEEADILLVIGTSLAVYPAANLVHFAVKATQKIIVDPKAENFKIHHEFIRIQATAVESIQELRKLLD